MAITPSRVTVTTAATKIADGSGSDGVAGASVLVKNRGTVTVTVGDSTVTTATGFDIDPGDAVPIDMFSGDALYGIVAAGTCAVQCLKVGA